MNIDINRFLSDFFIVFQWRENMTFVKKIPFYIIVFYSISAYATDVADFSSFYGAYKTNVPQNNINITSDLTATQLVGVAGSSITDIDGGGYNFNGGNYNGFTVSSESSIYFANSGNFTISGQNATIENSVNSFYQSGRGAVFSNVGGDLTIENSAFSNNSSRYGGGVFYQTNSGNLNISNSAFQNNSVTRSNGGVIYNQYRTTANIDGSYFQNNSAVNYGGVVFNDGNLNITNSVFNANTASSGAAIYNSNTVTMSDVYFVGNNGTDSVGAVYTTGMMDITNGTFENNTGETGGAIGVYGIIGDVLYTVVKDSTFTNNSATYGGALYNWDDTYIIDSSFSNNTATDGGGAIFNINALFLIAQNSDIEFTGNTSSGESNAIYTTEMLGINAAENQQVIFNDKITGSGSIVINNPYTLEENVMPTGGTVILNEDMSGFVGNITIASGNVQLTDNGKFFSAEDLQVSGGVLDLGTTNATVGSATFGSGSALKLSVQSEDNYGYLNADIFSISEDALLNVVLNSDVMTNRDSLQFQFLRSSNEITDNFLPEIDNNIYAFVKLGNGWYEVLQESTFLDIIRLSGGSQNNENTAISWQTVPIGEGEIANEVYELLDLLVQTDAGEYIKALTALAPSPAPLMQILGTSYSERFEKLISLDSRLESDFGNGKLWVAALGSSGRLKEDKVYANFDIYGYGFGLGAEFEINNWDIGAVYTYQYDRLKSWARIIHAPANGGGLYAKYYNNGFIWNNVASIFYSDLSETKNVAGLQLYDDMGVYTTSLWSDLGYEIPVYDTVLTPSVGMKYTFMHRQNSVDTAGQELSSANLDFLMTYADVSVQHVFEYDNGFSFAPVLSFGGSYDLLAEIDDINVEISNNIYSISSERLPQWQAIAGLKIKMWFGDLYGLEIGADATWRKGYSNYTGMLKGSMRF